MENSSECCCLIGEKCKCEVEDENTLWKEICREFDEERNKIQTFISEKNKNADAPCHPIVGFFETEIAPVLKNALLSTVKEAETRNCLDRQTNDFDPIDHIAEYMWNHNTNFPERETENQGIHDMDWVKDYLIDNPRPFFPFHLIWSNEYAAIKIQSYVRGYWVRRQEEVQEVRKFWKQLKDEARRSETTISRRFYLMD